jgi:hypothetical protein
VFEFAQLPELGESVIDVEVAVVWIDGEGGRIGIRQLEEYRMRELQRTSPSVFYSAIFPRRAERCCWRRLDGTQEGHLLPSRSDPDPLMSLGGEIILLYRNREYAGAWEMGCRPPNPPKRNHRDRDLREVQQCLRYSHNTELDV